MELFGANQRFALNVYISLFDCMELEIIFISFNALLSVVWLVLVGWSLFACMAVTNSGEQLLLLRKKVFAGNCAIAIALGLSRFDFGIVARLMQQADWITTTDIGELAGFNVAGYVIGCIDHSRDRTPQGVYKILFLSLFLLIASLWLESINWSFSVRLIFRFLNGWSAGHLVCGVPGLALSGASKQQSRRYTSILVSGAGIGSLIGAFGIGWIAAESPSLAWVAISAFATLLAVPVFWLLTVSWKTKAGKVVFPSQENALHKKHQVRYQNFKLAGLASGYSLIGAGMVPVVLYGPLIATQRLGAGPALSSDSFALFGIGSVVGCFVASVFPSRWSNRTMLPLISLIGLLGSVMYLKADALYLEMIAIFLVGSWAYMTVSLSYDRLGELLDESQKRRWWALISSFLGGSYSAFALIFSRMASISMQEVLTAGVVLMGCQLLMELLQRSGIDFGRPEP